MDSSPPVDLQPLVKEKPDDAECVRELCRKLCQTCGINEHTQMLADLWVLLTQAKVQVSMGHSGGDITQASMGPMPVESLDFLGTLENLTGKQKFIYKLEILKSIETLENCKAAETEIVTKTMWVLQNMFDHLERWWANVPILSALPTLEKSVERWTFTPGRLQ